MKTQLVTDAAALAGSIGLGLAEAPVPGLGSLVQGTWNGHALHECVASEILAEDDGSLALHLTEPRFVYAGIVRDAPLNMPVEIRTTTGLLRARWGLLGNSSFGTSGKSATLYLEAWTWTSGTEPVAWFGTLQGARVARGNLVVTGRGGANFRGQLLEGGGLRWFVWPRRVAGRSRRRRDESDVVVEVLHGSLDRDRVVASIRVVEFVLGAATRLCRLVGVDARGKPVAAIGVEHDRALADRRVRCPVRDELYDPRWHGELFRRVADVVARDGDNDRTFLATQAYLDALEHHLDGGYLTAQVALEAFVTRVSPKETTTRVRDKAAWLAWVDARREEIAAMALDPARGEVLVNALRSLWRESSSRAVARYFERKGLPLPRQVLDEVLRRNTVAHELLMSEEEDRDVDRDLDRLSLIQTVLVAALALHVGYDGPIAGGYNSDQDPLWWPHRLRGAPDGEFLIDLDALSPASK